MIWDTKLLFGSLISGILLRTSGALLNFLAVPVALKILGQEGYAAFATLLGLAAWLQLSNLGMGSTTAIAVAGLNDDNAGLRALFWRAVVSTAIFCGLIALVSFFPFTHTISGIFDSTPEQLHHDLRAASYFCFIGFLVAAFGQTFEGFYTGRMRNAYVNWCRLVGQVVGILFLFLLSQTSGSMLALCFCVTFGPLSAGIWFIARGFVDCPPPKQLNYSIRDSLPLFRQGFGFLASSLTVLFYGGGSLPIFALAFGSAELSTAGVIARVVQMYFSLIAIVLIPFGAGLKRNLASGDFGWAKRIFVVSGAFTVGSGIIVAIVLILFGERLITYWTGIELASLKTWILPTAALVLAIGWAYFWIYACFATVGATIVAKTAITEVAIISFLYFTLGDAIPPSNSLYIMAAAMVAVSGTVLPFVVSRAWAMSSQPRGADKGL